MLMASSAYGPGDECFFFIGLGRTSCLKCGPNKLNNSFGFLIGAHHYDDKHVQYKHLQEHSKELLKHISKPKYILCVFLLLCVYVCGRVTLYREDEGGHIGTVVHTA